MVKDDRADGARDRKTDLDVVVERGRVLKSTLVANIG